MKKHGHEEGIKDEYEEAMKHEREEVKKDGYDEVKADECDGDNLANFHDNEGVKEDDCVHSQRYV